MSADVLRQAAALMRERAQAASNGGKTPWLTTQTSEERFDGYEVWTFAENHHWTVTTSDFAGDAEHIASWHPAVALAVADWLDAVADTFENEVGVPEDLDAWPPFRVARAYLGESA